MNHEYAHAKPEVLDGEGPVDPMAEQGARAGEEFLERGSVESMVKAVEAMNGIKIPRVRLDAEDRAVLRLFMPPADGVAAVNMSDALKAQGDPEAAMRLLKETRMANRPQMKRERVRRQLNAGRREGKSERWVGKRLLKLTYRGLLETPAGPRHAWLGSSFRISEMGMRAMEEEKTHH